MTATDNILIIGGGVIGLACAVELQLRGAKVTVLSRNLKSAAVHAAAGMLAPGAEKIPEKSPMFDLCERSLWLYPEWTAKLEEITGINTGYWQCGILSPVFDEKYTNEKITSNYGTWLDKETIHQQQKGLGEKVIGGWWYPEDGQVDNRLLIQGLYSAAETLGVEIKEGITVEAIRQRQGEVIGLQTNVGNFQGSHYLLATGAWSHELLPLPVYPKKGQMLSVRTPDNLPNFPLKRVLFGENIYIVPRKDGTIIIGATMEGVGFTPHNTPAGINSLLKNAIELYPELQNYPIQELWWGFRPGTDDELPILGNGSCKNLTVATGHHRNGILLTPITAKLIADLIWDGKQDPLLSHFHYKRQQNPQNNQNSSHPTMLITTPTQILDTQSGQTQRLSQKLIEDSPLQIAGKTFTSRLMTGTGKYRTIEEMQQSVDSSECQIVTVAVRRVQTNAPGHEGLAEALDWTKIWMLPNTAGCKTAEEAIRVARLGREMAKLLGQEDNNFVKLEVIPDAKYLLPDPIGTLEAAQQLVKEGFVVLPYINADPMLAKRLEEVGCATVMPLAAPIGSGQGLQTTANIRIIIENANIPVVVDAGIGTPSEAAQAMEMGADALLINSAIALAQNPAAMAKAMNLGAIAGRLAYLSGRMPIKNYANASSPLTGVVGSN
jgi:thiazole synthase